MAKSNISNKSLKLDSAQALYICKKRKLVLQQQTPSQIQRDDKGIPFSTIWVDLYQAPLYKIYSKDPGNTLKIKFTSFLRDAYNKKS